MKNKDTKPTEPALPAGQQKANTADTPIRTLRELAEHLGQPLTTVSRWVRDHRWTFGRRGPWERDLKAEMLRWAATMLDRTRVTAEGPVGAPRGRLAELRERKLQQEERKIAAQADIAETEVAVRRGQLHDARECEEETANRFGLVRTALQNLPAQMVALAIGHGLPNEAAPQYQRKLDEMVSDVLLYLSKSASDESIAEQLG